jgi:hypothetical protein
MLRIICLTTKISSAERSSCDHSLCNSSLRKGIKGWACQLFPYLKIIILNISSSYITLIKSLQENQYNIGYFTSYIMHSAVISSLLLAAIAVASPIANVAVNSSILTDKTMALCEEAENCELYETEFGTSMRFKPGMAPGEPGFQRRSSSDSSLVTRAHATADHTNVELGGNSLNYGSTRASGENGVIHHLYDICGYSTCIGSVQIETTLVDSVGANAAKEYIVLTAVAQYDGYEQRNAFINAIVDAMANGETCEDKNWANGGGFGNWADYNSGTVHECTQASVINVNAYASPDNGAMFGFMNVEAKLGETKPAWCGGVGPEVTAAIQGIFGAVPALGGASGAFFGSVQAACG